jgi:hypothetical protein
LDQRISELSAVKKKSEICLIDFARFRRFGRWADASLRRRSRKSGEAVSTSSRRRACRGGTRVAPPPQSGTQPDSSVY